MTKLCLYQNAKTDVKYVFGSPVTFDPLLVKEREAIKADMLTGKRSVPIQRKPRSNPREELEGTE